MSRWDDNPLVYVAESPIHGRGLFARQEIAAGSYIGWVSAILSHLMNGSASTGPTRCAS